MPTSVSPMLALPTKSLPRSERDYYYEFKWDGMRAITFWDGRHLRIRSRTAHPQERRFPELAALGRKLGNRRAILDGEVIAIDKDNRPSFQLLAHRMHLDSPPDIEAARKRIPVTYMIFDVLYYQAISTMDFPFVQRRELLETLAFDGPSWHLSTLTIGEGKAMLDAARRQSLEGIIAKRSNSLYEPGKRTGAWLKLKLIAQQEFVIGGWVPEATAGPSRVGSLLMGYYDGKRLRYAGRVGSGFDQSWHTRLTRDLLQRETGCSPFAEVVPKSAVRFVKPDLVAQIEYRRWPESGLIQQAAFKGLCDDMPSVNVVDERP